jgi:adenylate cyclase
MDALLAYLPEDRARALAGGVALPGRTHGAALFADISGFTPLTEALSQALGPRAGIDALSDQINAVYTSLTAVVARWRGSVISFSGDAITCWFDDADGPAVPRAAACGLTLQEAMAPFAAVPLPSGRAISLALKVAIASGPARRCVVGDPAIQQIDVLAGRTLVRMADGEHLARPGEVLLDDVAVTALGPGATLGERRVNPETGEGFVVLHGLAHSDPDSAPELVCLPAEALRPWVLPVVWEHESAGLGAFLTELRPAVTLFLRFSGLDLDADEIAGERLDAFVQRVQATLADAGGSLLQLTVGDKGTYLYAAFGAPVAHEDDARRAAHTAIALHAAAADLGLPPVQIGLSQGTLRCGVYGGLGRHTYGVLGDDVNLAARLMSKAAPGETLLSGRVQQALGDTFSLEPRTPIPIKGKAEPLPVFALTGITRRRAARLQESAYTLPMVGRDGELARIGTLIERVLAGEGQVVTIVGEAGIGKSRLVAEVMRLAQRRGLAGYGGAAQSSGSRIPYLAWRSVFQAMLGADPSMPLRRQVRWLVGELEDRVPERAEMLPLLGTLLELPLPESEITEALDPKARKGALEALLVDLVSHAAREEAATGGGLLLVLEDLHWLDPLATDLLMTIARAAARLPMLLVLACRPPEHPGVEAEISALSYTTTITLESLDTFALEGLVRARLAQLYPERAAAPPRRLLEQLHMRSQGNPFYTEELLNYLHDRGVDPYDPEALDALALPDTLHRLVLARIDQLSESERTTLRMASVVGRVFYASWLHGFAPELGVPARVQADLERLARIELTLVETAEPELTYLFKHIVTQEVTYASLTQVTRERLHEQLARWLEQTFADQPPLDLLAYHYDRTANAAKRREYLRRAGDAARAIYANEAAVDYYVRLLGLLTTPGERCEVLLLLGGVRVEIGRWAEAQATYTQVVDVARAAGDQRRTAEALSWRGRALTELGDYAAAYAALDGALALAEQLDDDAERLRAERYLGLLALLEGKLDEAGRVLAMSLEQARRLDDRNAELRILINLGNQAELSGDAAGGEAHHRAALRLARGLGDRWHEGIELANLSELASRRGKPEEARELARQSVVIDRSLGNHAGVALTLTNLAEMACFADDLPEAVIALREALQLSLIGGSTFVLLCVLLTVARAQVSAGAILSAAELLRLVVQHSGFSAEAREQAREIAAGAGLDLDAPPPPLEVGIAVAERWLVSFGARTPAE